MKTLIIGIMSPLLVCLTVGAQVSSVSKLREAPIQFVENRGVYPAEVSHFIRGVNKALYFTPSGVTIALENGDARWAVKLDFVDARRVQPRGEDAQGTVFSYFVGKRADWKTGLPGFGKLVYPELWPGIDLVYRGTVNRMKYAFVVKPGADPSRIRLRYRGASHVHVTPAGALHVGTPLGSFEDATPVAWQDTADGRAPVEMAYDLAPGHEADVSFGFRIGSYDAARPLLLDPAVFIYCGYVGGNDYDDNYGAAVDAAGNAYVTGETNSATPTFPALIGPDTTYNGNSDAYVAKIGPTGNLLFCGYIGGTDYDYGEGVAADAQQNVIVTGYTESDEVTEQFPVKIGPDLTFNGPSTGGGDGFVTKISASGTSLVYSGYIGGANDEYPFDVTTDTAGNAYVVGCTDSTQTTFPVVVGPDLTFNDTSGGTDVFACKVSPTGGIVYCGYIGGTLQDGNWGGIAVDTAGNAYVTAETNSNNTTDQFPTLVGPTLVYGGQTDTFVAKIAAAGNALLYCGYIGGTQGDFAGGIAVDASGCACVAGATYSDQSSFPVAVGPDLTHNGPSPSGSDAFVAKVNALGSAFVYCGYIGGSDQDFGWGAGVNAAGNCYVSGGTDSTEATFPVVVGPDLTYNGNTDAFVARVNLPGTGLDYCGYIGGTDYDESWSLAVDAAGNAYPAGDTDSDAASQQFPVVVGPDVTYNQGTDAFLARVSFVDITAGGSTRIGQAVTLQLTATADGGLGYQVGSSLGIGPTPLGNNRTIGLSVDSLLVLSVNNLVPQIFSGYAGFIGSNGQAQAGILIPNLSALVGTRINTAFVTLLSTAPSGIRSISNTASFSITP